MAPTETEPKRRIELSTEEEALIRAMRKAKNPEPDWSKTKKTCAKCGEEKYVIPDFGTIDVRGVRRPQGYCRTCRSNNYYRSRPRVYVTKNSDVVRPQGKKKRG